MQYTGPLTQNETQEYLTLLDVNVRSSSQVLSMGKNNKSEFEVYSRAFQRFFEFKYNEFTGAWSFWAHYGTAV